MKQLNHALVVAISSRALFDLSESHEIYETQGVDAYQAYQIAHENDPLNSIVRRANEEIPIDHEVFDWTDLVFGLKRPFVIPNLENPTAEVMARILYEKSIELLPKELKVVNVRLFETPTCYADHPGVSYL